MDTFLSKRPRVFSGSSSSSASVGNEIGENAIISYLGLRKPIDSFVVNIQDRIRREYVAKGPCQPKGRAFPKTQFGNDGRSFRDCWFNSKV